MDYRGIEALCAVIELQNFEAAAQKLFITQSAVSQRIRGLETHYGEPVLIRTPPYRPTKLGNQLVVHYRRITLLEEDCEREIASNAQLSTKFSTLKIAINRESLEGWFLDFMKESHFAGLLIEVIADDEQLTQDYFKNGVVSACLSTSSTPIVGGEAHFLGNVEYVLAVSADFAQRHFKEDLTDCPAIKFDQHDILLEQYLQKYFRLPEGGLNYHVIPSITGIKTALTAGMGCALISTLAIQPELQTKKIISLYPDKKWQVPIYWHNWANQSKFYREFNQSIIHFVKNRLKPNA